MMDRRASTAETVCETGLRRIAEATERAGLSDVAEEALALLPWVATVAQAAREEAQPPQPDPPKPNEDVARLLGAMGDA